MCCFTYFTFVVHTIKFIPILLVRSFGDTSKLKRKSLSFPKNIDKDLLENDMELDDDVLYNFTDDSLGGALPLIFCMNVHFGTYLLGVLFTLKK